MPSAILLSGIDILVCQNKKGKEKKVNILWFIFFQWLNDIIISKLFAETQLFIFFFLVFKGEGEDGQQNSMMKD